MLQSQQEHAKLVIKNGRYVCPNCKQITNQKVSERTCAQALILWCRNCKAEFIVNIDHGQCSVVSRCR